jgi:hypothetical protein
MNYALIDATGLIVRRQSFDGSAPQLAPEKGLRWVDDDMPTWDSATQRPPRAVEPVTGDAVEYVVEAIPLAVKQAEVIAAADRKAKTVRDAVVANISAAEMASWPIKRAEGLAYQASANAADAPNLALEAQARGVTLADLVAKVINKSAMLSALEAAIAGRCGALQDAARAATTVAELAAIDIEAGWPA